MLEPFTAETTGTWANQWLLSHCEQQLSGYGGPHPLTWYVSAQKIYLDYSKAAYQSGYKPLTFNQLYSCLKSVFLDVKPGRIRNHPVYTGVRYFTDKVGGHLDFGI